MQKTNSSDDATDDTLLLRTGQGDLAAFRLLIQRHQGKVTRVACRLLNGDRSAAEDVGQEAFLRLFRAAKSYTARGEISAFLLTTTRNLCRDRLRREHPTEALDSILNHVDPSSTGEGSLLLQERAEAMRQAIAALPEEQKLEGIPYCDHR